MQQILNLFKDLVASSSEVADLQPAEYPSCHRP